MKGMCYLFAQGQWYNTVSDVLDDSAVSIWFDDEYYDSCGEKGTVTKNFNSEYWRSRCFSSDRTISY